MSTNPAPSSQSASPTGAAPSPPRRSGGRRAALVAAVSGVLLVGLVACNGATAPSSGAGKGGGKGASITVQGQVVGVYGAPLPNVPVLIGTTTTTTAADGSFTVAGVTTPYDVALYLDPAVLSTSRPTALVFEGLTRADPTLEVLADSGTFSSDQLGGTTSRQLDQAANENGVLLAAGANFGEGGALLDYSDTPNFGTFPMGWGGSAARATTLFAITADVDTTTNLPTTYTGYAAVPLTLQDGQDQTSLSIPLTTTGLTQVQVQGSVTMPSGYTVTNASNCVPGGSPPCLNMGTTVLVRFASGAEGASLALGQDVTAAPVPRYSGGTLGSAFVARAEPSGATTDDTYTMAVLTATAPGPTSLTLQAPPAKLTPADNATGVTTGTDFSWQAASNSVYIMDLGPTSGSNSDPEIMIVTASTHLTLPDLSALGIQLPTGQVAYDYNLITVGSFASMDEFVGVPDLFLAGQALTQGLFPHFYNGSNGPYVTDFPVPDLTITQSAPFTVTTP